MPASWARSAWFIRIVTSPAFDWDPRGSSSATSWESTPATRLGTVWKDWREIRSLAVRRRRTSAATSFTVMSG